VGKESAKIAFIGGCQVVSLAAAARVLMPRAEVQAWHVGVFPVITKEALAELLSGYESVFSQLPDNDSQGPLASSRLRQRGINTLFIPTVAFPGFHPDSTYVFRQDGSVVPAALSDYHSKLVAACYLLDIPCERVPQLFNSLVFHELGYLQGFAAAKSAFLDRWSQVGFDLGAPFERWMNTGSFMYTLNHPHIRVLAEISRLELLAAGHISEESVLTDLPDDPLANGFIIPVYPPLAKRLGVSGSNEFLRSAHGLPPGESRVISLNDYVAANYRYYETIDRDLLSAPTIVAAKARLHVMVAR
jgi:hypothetical protein